MDPTSTDPIARFVVAHGRVRSDEGVPEPDAAVLATVDADGRPSARVILVRHVDEAGFAFFTNYGSRKAAELDTNPVAALCYYWGHREEQVRVEGRVERTSREESAAYFARRRRGSQIGAWASQQSQLLESREALEAAVARAEAEYPGEVPCPPFWGGYRLIPDAIEFWIGRQHRLHDRERYTRRPDGSWALERLYP